MTVSNTAPLRGAILVAPGKPTQEVRPKSVFTQLKLTGQFYLRLGFLM